MARVEDFTDDLIRRDERIRTRTVNGVEYTIQCFDPYGHWRVVPKNGKAPAAIDGWYTESELLWKAVQAYEDARPKPMERTIISTDGKGGKKRIPLDSVITE